MKQSEYSVLVRENLEMRELLRHAVHDGAARVFPGLSYPTRKIFDCRGCVTFVSGETPEDGKPAFFPNRQRGLRRKPPVCRAFALDLFRLSGALKTASFLTSDRAALGQLVSAQRFARGHNKKERRRWQNPTSGAD